MWKASFVIAIITLTACGQVLSTRKVVCVIGAGAAGVTSAKLLAQYPEEFEPIVFEKQSSVGGNWIYTDSTTVDEHGLPVPDSVYKSLRINLPKHLEAFPDYPEFRGDESTGDFPLHTDMAQYLRNYTKHYNIDKYIKGDSGGPLAANSELVGIVSWSDGDYCHDKYRNVFTNVEKYKEFIKFVTN